VADSDLARRSKKALAEGRTLVFIDESGFRLLPLLVRTWAPRGKTPILRVPLSWKHLSAIAAITPQGKLFTRIQQRGFKAPDIVRFLQHLLRFLPGKLLIIWDNLSAHASKKVKDLVGQHHDRLLITHLPPYAPELNPVELLWSHLKQGELKNLVCSDLPQLLSELRKAIWRVRHRKDTLKRFIQHIGLYHV